MQLGVIDLPEQVTATDDTGRGQRRYSTDPSDRGYRPWKLLFDLGIWVDVYLNGTEERDVITADEGEGLIVRGVRGSDGQLCLTEDMSGVALETVVGEVTFGFRAG